MDTLDRIAAVIDQISIWSGKIVSWLIFPMFLVLFYEVLVRKFWHPTIWANDLATGPLQPRRRSARRLAFLLYGRSTWQSIGRLGPG